MPQQRTNNPKNTPTPDIDQKTRSFFRQKLPSDFSMKTRIWSSPALERWIHSESRGPIKIHENPWNTTHRLLSLVYHNSVHLEGGYEVGDQIAVRCWSLRWHQCRLTCTQLLRLSSSLGFIGSYAHRHSAPPPLVRNHLYAHICP